MFGWSHRVLHWCTAHQCRPGSIHSARDTWSQHRPSTTKAFLYSITLSTCFANIDCLKTTSYFGSFLLEDESMIKISMRHAIVQSTGERLRVFAKLLPEDSLLFLHEALSSWGHSKVSLTLLLISEGLSLQLFCTGGRLLPSMPVLGFRGLIRYRGVAAYQHHLWVEFADIRHSILDGSCWYFTAGVIVTFFRRRDGSIISSCMDVLFCCRLNVLDKSIPVHSVRL